MWEKLGRGIFVELRPYDGKALKNGEVIAEFKVMLDRVLAEDFSMVESLQNAVGAAGFTPGRMCRLERGVQHYIKHCLSRLCAMDGA